MAVPAARGASGAARAGLSQLHTGSVTGGARLKEKSPQEQDRMDILLAARPAHVSDQRKGEIGTSWV